MPADCEMLLSRSAPAFGCPLPLPLASPLAAGFLAEYSPLRLAPRPASPTPPAFAPAAARQPPRALNAPAAAMPVAAPRRPCLVVRPEETVEDMGGDLPSPTRLKKKVVFADDKGLALTQVRVMREPSAAPPAWSMAFLEQVRRSLGVAVAAEEAAARPPAEAEAAWTVSFAQPAADYVRFRSRIDTNYVSLENVIVREAEGATVGTVKVRNICFRKEVLVRSSSDSWASQQDTFCAYVPSCAPALAGSVAAAAAGAGAAPLYDTFSFRLPLPPRTSRLDFCVCFRCEDGREFWDNNDGENYVLLRKATGEVPVASAGLEGPVANAPAAPRADGIKAAGKCGDALYAKMDAWSEFASWNHLVNDGPYW